MYERLGFILEKYRSRFSPNSLTDVQTSRGTDGRTDSKIEVRVEGEDRSLSENTCRGIAECVF